MNAKINTRLFPTAFFEANNGTAYHKDARYTATGDDRGMFGVTALGDYFRDLNDERNEFETQIVMIEAQEPAND